MGCILDTWMESRGLNTKLTLALGLQQGSTTLGRSIPIHKG